VSNKIHPIPGYGKIVLSDDHLTINKGALAGLKFWDRREIIIPYYNIKKVAVGGIDNAWLTIKSSSHGKFNFRFHDEMQARRAARKIKKYV
jgi:hypothetical protein